jgi:uncharacterized membrane protein
MIALFLACAPEDAAVPAECADLPAVSWESFGEGLVVEHCQPCHASTAENRHGAPASVTFDDEASVLAAKDRVLAVATGTDATMPPSIGMPEDDEARLYAWLACGH